MFIAPHWTNINFFCCSSEGVCVVLQMLDLLCKLKEDVIGLEVCGFCSVRFEVLHLKCDFALYDQPRNCGY